MKKFCLFESKHAFSLAEAMITLLIVCLIVIASIPVLTKKRRSTEAQNHGKWVCTLNEKGKHTVWTKASNEWVETGDSCTFTAPLNARNFAVSAVGGGGGGASARKENKVWTSDFRVDYYGKYKMAAVGAGGEAGKHNCGSSGGGGAGGVGYLEYVLDENAIQIKMSAGQPNNTGNWNGGSGGASYIHLVSQTDSGNNSTIELLRADGGGGGGGRYKNGIGVCASGSGDGGAQGGVYGVSGYQAFNSASGHGVTHCDRKHPCNGKISDWSITSINNLMQPYKFFEVPASDYAWQIGIGGYPTSDSWFDYTHGRNGLAGAVMVTAEIYGSGGGGKAGQHKLKEFYPDFDNKSVKITIGAGGKGGVSNNGLAVNGTNGGQTVFGEYFTLDGGEGGKVNYIEKVALDTPGEDGVKTPMIYKTVPQKPLGGLSNDNASVNGLSSEGHGAGGGGGGIKPDENAGNGADGSPGVVIIEW